MTYRLSDTGVVKTITGTAKAKLQERSSREEIINRLNRQIGNAGIVGEENFNTHHRVIKRFVLQGDFSGAREYIRKQKQKF